MKSQHLAIHIANVNRPVGANDRTRARRDCAHWGSPHRAFRRGRDLLGEAGIGAVAVGITPVGVADICHYCKDDSAQDVFRFHTDISPNVVVC